MLDRKVLVGFLREVDKELIRNIILIAVGGTALTLLRAKPSTRDVDFTVPSRYYDDFQRALRDTPHGFYGRPNNMNNHMNRSLCVPLMVRAHSLNRSTTNNRPQNNESFVFRRRRAPTYPHTQNQDFKTTAS
jgi:hypothetical protein